MKKYLNINYLLKKYLNINIETFKQSKVTEEKKEVIINKTYNKIFCIGFNKTGTTSLEKTLLTLGFEMGDQRFAETISTDVSQGCYDKLVKLCQSAEAFQDVPFMFRDVYKFLDQEFPNSKFILTVRNNKEEWFDSLVRFHAKLFSSDKSKPPTEEDLANSNYVYKGWLLDMKEHVWGYPKIPLYDKKCYQEKYETHNEAVQQYFKDRTNDLLVLNLKDSFGFEKLIKFLNIKTNLNSFPWENKT